MKKFLTTVAITGLALGALSGCEEKKPVDKAADAAKSAVKETGKAVEKTGEAIKDAAKP